ncbi:hypothetical protein N7454_010942 [Penicillium verhagenii]|nr:hypothetical protein N7454_010942 [Penicillium verhagenii]
MDVSDYKRWDVSDSSRWGGASVEQVHSHYMEYLREMKQDRYGEQPRFLVCLMIDGITLKRITIGPLIVDT